MEYDFTLKYRLNCRDSNREALVDRLFEAGCDDALPGIGRPGRLALEFSREANSAGDALESAVRNVRSAIEDAELIEVAPDYAGLTDIAEHVGMSRQNLRKLCMAHGDSFPAAVHDGNPSLWHLSDVLVWLEQRGYSVDADTRDISAVAKEMNTALRSRSLSSERSRELEELIA